jgi:nucleotide-binding universal stress UspA family protein
MKVLESSTKIAFKNILFLTDFSEASQPAMEYAATLAKHHKATFYAGHIHTPSPPLYLEGNPLVDYLDEVRQQKRQELSQLIEPFGLNSKVLVSEGMIEYAIERWTVLYGIDLIVVGTHGWKGLERLLLGSTAELILRSAICPVLTVGPHVPKLEHEPEYVDRILFATDLTQQSEYAVSYALSFAHERCAHLTFLHVVPRDAHVPDHRRVMEYCERELRGLVPSDAELWCDPKFVVVEGDPAQEILNFAENDNSDLIVLGLPKDKVFSTHFRSGVTYSVVSSAPCPVLTVRDMLQER